MDVTLPDGTVINGVPEGTTKAQLAQKLTANGMTVPKAWTTSIPAAQPAKSVTTLPQSEQMIAAAKVLPEPLLAMGSSAILKPIGDIFGTAAIPLHAAGLIQTEPQQVRENIQGLAYQPKTEIGQAVTEYNPLALIGKGLGAIGNAAADVINPEKEDATTLRGMAANAAREAATQLPVLAAAKFAPTKAQIESNIKLYGKDVADAKQFMDKGFKIAPHEIKVGEKGAVSKIAEGIAGEKQISDTISLHNQEIGNQTARTDLGLLPDERITPDALANKKLEAYQPYDAISNYGKQVNLKFKLDSQLTKDITSITNKIIGTALAEERPTAGGIVKIRNAVDEVRKDIFGAGDNKGKLSPAATIDLVKRLREESSATYTRNKFGTVSTDDMNIAQVKYKAANALEDMLQRNLPKDMVSDLQTARKQLAKIHVYDDILNPETGNIAIRKLAGEKYKDAPFTEGLADLRKFATKYKDSSRPETQQRSFRVNPVETALAVTSALGKRPVHTALLAGRAATRPFLTSKPIQRLSVPNLEATPNAALTTIAATSPAEAERARRKKERAARNN